MKGLKNLLSTFLVGTMALSTSPISVDAANTTTYYAYSIGGDQGTAGDFSSNVYYAHVCYGMISGITSYYNNMPTVSYMKGNNPAGARKIGSRIVFLNSHANNEEMVFNYQQLVGSYYTGVYYGYDTTNDVGLLSTNMSGVDLISFVGCSTGAGTTNLPSRAVSQGATTAVGFTNNISSRIPVGQGWCQKYNDALANGYTIANSISYATSCYPTSNLGSYVTVYGSSTNVISSGGYVSSTGDFEELYTTDVEVPIDGLETINGVMANDLGESYSLLFDEIKDIEPTFDPDDYSAYVNMFSENDDNGMIVFRYMIGDKVETNYSFVASVSDGTVTSISKYFDEKPVADESNIIERANKYSFSDADRESYAKSLNISVSDISDESGFYFYDYNTGKLTYEKSIYYIAKEAGNVNIENSYSIEL